MLSVDECESVYGWLDKPQVCCLLGLLRTSQGSASGQDVLRAELGQVWKGCEGAGLFRHLFGVIGFI